ncbi:MAG: nicotinate-nucleotide adenylyltransferase [Lachnospiraceae bacterium]|nr:nicotinate-nucleotide adenylyltransferase [Lachnospiraceae bacterium]
MKKVGILGGTFDPIHLGHLIIGENAYDECGLENVFVMPSGQPPHKENSTISDEKHRSTMVKLAIAGNKHFEYSDFELNRKGNIYTADTLELLTSKYPDTHFYFILGEDSLLDIEKWYEPARIMELCSIVVTHRNDGDDTLLNKHIEYLKCKYNADIIKLDVPLIDISSTNIRERVSQGKTIRYFVNSEVEGYIYKNNLYKEVMDVE